MERDIEDTSKNSSSTFPLLLRKVSTLTTLSLPILGNPSQPTIAVSLTNASTVTTNAVPINQVPIYEESIQSLRLNEQFSNGLQSGVNSEDELSEGYMDSHHQDDADDEVDNDDLQSILTDLIRHERRVSHTRKPMSREDSQDDEPMTYLNLNVFPNPLEITNEYEFYDKHIAISKENNNDSFHNRLKHFFIFSTAGKPIYSMNGSDELIVGYMGILTTILSTFEENLHEEIKSIDVGNEVKIVALNKTPIVLVAISKVGYELLSNSQTMEESGPQENYNENITLLSQLNTLYNYFVSILSKPTIERSFQNRLNYDLRRVLNPLDFHNLDCLCMKMTYGLPLSPEKVLYDTSTFDFYISELLDSSLQTIRITNTTRTRLNQILVSCKTLKLIEPDDDKVSIKSDRLASVLGIKQDNDKYLASDLLFAMITTTTGKIISFMKPKNHNLPNEDLKLLFSIIDSSKTHVRNGGMSEDMWFPLCMPNFNPNGFLYVFVKSFEFGDHIPESSRAINVILISSNKNSFYHMREVSNFIIHKITKHRKFLEKFDRELDNSGKLSISRDIKVPIIKHFIYKSKKYDQFVMSDFIHFDKSLSSILQLVYFYSSLHNKKATRMKSRGNYNVTTPSSSSTNQALEANNFKKLTYAKWSCNLSVITGFMLSDNDFAFYCLCDDYVNSKDLIAHSLRIIKWCEKNHRRLFIQKGVSV